MKPQPPMLSPCEVATRLGVHVQTIADWRKRGIGPPFAVLAPNVIRYDPADLERWVCERKTEAAWQA